MGLRLTEAEINAYIKERKSGVSPLLTPALTNLSLWSTRHLTSHASLRSHLSSPLITNHPKSSRAHCCKQNNHNLSSNSQPTIPINALTIRIPSYPKSSQGTFFTQTWMNTWMTNRRKLPVSLASSAWNPKTPLLISSTSSVVTSILPMVRTTRGPRYTNLSHLSLRKNARHLIHKSMNTTLIHLSSLTNSRPLTRTHSTNKSLTTHRRSKW